MFNQLRVSVAAGGTALELRVTAVSTRVQLRVVASQLSLIAVASGDPKGVACHDCHDARKSVYVISH